MQFMEEWPRIRKPGQGYPKSERTGLTFYYLMAGTTLAPALHRTERGGRFDPTTNAASGPGRRRPESPRARASRNTTRSAPRPHVGRAQPWVSLRDLPDTREPRRTRARDRVRSRRRCFERGHVPCPCPLLRGLEVGAQRRRFLTGEITGGHDESWWRARTVPIARRRHLAT